MPSDDLMPDLLQEIPMTVKPRMEEVKNAEAPPTDRSPAVRPMKGEKEEQKKEEDRSKPLFTNENIATLLKPPFNAKVSISIDSSLKDSLQNGLNQMLNAGDYRYADLSDLLREALALYLHGFLKPAPHPHVHKGRRVQMTLRLNDRFKALMKERIPQKARRILVDRILRVYLTGHMEYRPTPKNES